MTHSHPHLRKLDDLYNQCRPQPSVYAPTFPKLPPISL